MSQVFDKNFERNNRLKALAYTILVNAGLFLIIISVNVWTEDPSIEIAAGGFEINYGDSNIGSGINESLESPNLNNANDLESTENVDNQPQPPRQSSESALISSKENSPVKITEKEAEENVDKNANVNEKESVKPVKAEPIINNNALFKSRPKRGGNSNGDDIGKVGDKGQLDGDLNNGGLYSGPKGSGGGSGGGTGGGNGLSLNITGWRLKSAPVVNDNTSETGTISFNIKIDDSGNIISLQQRESTLSIALSKKYKEAVAKCKFVPNSSGIKSSISSGTISFNVKAR